MATPLTPVVSKGLPFQGNAHRYVYEIPSVLVSSTSPRYELDIATDAGRIEQVRLNYPGVPPGSFTDVVGFIFTSDLGTRGSIDHLIETPVISDGCFSQAGNMGIYFENTDPTPASTSKLGSGGVPRLYVEIDNNGTSFATGTLSLEIIIKAAGQPAL